MSWVIWSLLAATLWATNNVIDKYLLSRTMSGASAGALAVLTGLVSLPFGLVFFILARHQLEQYTLEQAAGAMAAGLLLATSYYLYFRALAAGRAVTVLILFQLTIAFNLGFGRLVLGEHLATGQLLFLVAVAGAAVLLDWGRNGWRLELSRRVVAIMVAASLAASASDVTFKWVAGGGSYLPSQLFIYMAMITLGLAVYALSPRTRQTLVALWDKRHQALGLVFINESLNLAGVMVFNFALLLAPIALVSVAVSVQSVIMALFGLAALRWWPDWETKTPA
jgi:drug/metabolite transporter (DMT)-like permease